MKKRIAYTIEVVEERISFYENQIMYLIKNDVVDQKLETSQKLLNFWTKYKEKHFK